MSRAWPTLYLRLGSSRRLICFVLVLHFGGAICVTGSDLPPVAIVLILLGLGLSLIRGLGTHATRRRSSAIVLIIWDERGHWHLLRRDGRSIEACLAPGGYAHPSLVALVFVTRRRRKLPLVIVDDAVDPEALRSLCVRLRCSS